MSVKNSNKIVPVTLPKFHYQKLAAICQRTGLSKSGVIHRMIEEYKLFEIADEIVEGKNIVLSTDPV